MDFFHQTHPNGRWWLKADGTDIQQRLRESMRNKWSGDVDLGDGNLQDKYSKYAEYCCICLNNRSSLDNIKEDLQKQTSNLLTAKELRAKGHTDAQKEYKNFQELLMLLKSHCLLVPGKLKSTKTYWRRTYP